MMADLLDEFISGSPIDAWLEIGQAGVQVTGFVLTAVGLFSSYRVLESRLRRARDARAEARRSQEAFQTLFEEAPVGFWEADVEGTIRRANHAAHQMLGLPAEGLLGTNASGLVVEGGVFPPVDEDRSDPSQHQLSLWHADGGIRTFSVHQKPIVDSTGRLGGTRTALVDITSRVELEQERTRLEAQVRHRQKLETIGTLAGGIAHDFNNLLAPILGYVEIAIEELPKDSIIRDDLQQVGEAAARAKHLVQQILSFSRQSEGERRVTRVQEVVEEVSGLLRHSVPSTVEVRMELDADCPPVYADPTRLHQVIMNLCTNAVHAMRQTGGVLSLRLAAADPSHLDLPAHLPISRGSHVRLTMSDTGHGIDAAHLERIFDPFFTTKDAGEGTGLGLSVVHGIVAAYGGDIAATSRPGHGTTFEVVLPAADTEADPEASSEASEAPGQGCGRILVVDDDDGVRGLTVRILERLGYDVVQNRDPTVALEAVGVGRHAFDLVITDQTMPEMTGLHLAKALRTVRPELKVMLVTGYSEAITEESAAEAGISKVLLKPFGKAELGEAVQSLLEESGTPS
jgi:PAS domain S-box-containing protein